MSLGFKIYFFKLCKPFPRNACNDCIILISFNDLLLNLAFSYWVLWHIKPCWVNMKIYFLLYWNLEVNIGWVYSLVSFILEFLGQYWLVLYQSSYGNNGLSYTWIHMETLANWDHMQTLTSFIPEPKWKYRFYL